MSSREDKSKLYQQLIEMGFLVPELIATIFDYFPKCLPNLNLDTNANILAFELVDLLDKVSTKHFQDLKNIIDGNPPQSDRRELRLKMKHNGGVKFAESVFSFVCPKNIGDVNFGQFSAEHIYTEVMRIAFNKGQFESLKNEVESQISSSKARGI